MKTIALPQITRPFRATVQVPGSKSITNRALPLAAMAAGVSTLTGVLFADDTRAMIGALQALGYGLAVDEARCRVTVEGRGDQIPEVARTLHCGNSGTTIRFLAAMLAAGPGRYTLDGIERMRERPVGQLVDQLRALGAEISYEVKDGFPPLTVGGGGAGGRCTFRDAKSSQYISAILMAAAIARKRTAIYLAGPITSEPYVQMTMRMMRQFGLEDITELDEAGGKTLMVAPGRYLPREYPIEPDASNASYFLAAAALTKGASITVRGLGGKSLQGDVKFADILERAGADVTLTDESVKVTGTGVVRGLDLDMNHIPDMVQTLAVAALFADSPTTVRNVGNLRIKETDRLAALETELRKLGATVSTTEDSIHIIPPQAFLPASIATYDDHRMAMAFSLAAMHIPGTVIETPGCTAKTYPNFFADLQAAIGQG